MNEKKIEPTQAMVDIVDLADKLMVMDTRDLLRTALNHPDAPGLIECDHTDYVHVDEAATRVEAARLKGWDDAAQWLRDNEWPALGARIYNANPHRPAPALPAEEGTFIVPADGYEHIEATADGAVWRTREAVLDISGDLVGAWVSGADIAARVDPRHLTSGTWKVEDE